MDQAHPRPTLSDVAREAAVSSATASRALNDHPDVSEVTKQRVREVATRIGFRASRTARALRRGSFRAVSAIVPDLVWGWWEPVLRAASQEAAERGIHLLVHPVAGTEGGLAAVIDSLANVPTEGVIVVSVPDQESVRDACARIGLPVVAIDDTSHAVHVPSIAARNREGARAMVEHLLSIGRRRIAFVGASADHFGPHWGEGRFIGERLSGYHDALTAAGVDIDPSFELGWESPGDETIPTLPELDRLLGTTAGPDAVFCAADLLAAPVLRTLSARGLSVPGDIAVAGFDDERAALLLSPQLTTMRQPYDEMGRVAVEMLTRILAGEPVPVQRHELDTTLVLRASTVG
ncbi:MULTISPECIES: LacI family DNA-binding transcriptional regulator [unclassified Microbacterium]|uniref:LacI family DNA-binding transcriptional regulator n=1 Tax=unclassified Microbacterium TaxID=2609290 RepID=UPI0030174F09